MASSSRRESARIKAKSSSSISKRSEINMVVNTPEWNFKRQKLSKEQTEGEGEDRISFLPDTILHHILSLLTTRCALSTCILSTKWKHLWTSISNLDFSDKLSYSYTTHVVNPLEEVKFVKFVEKVLHLHDATCIRKFYLSSGILLEASRVSAWIDLVLNRDVKVVKLKINVDKTSVLPSALFARESLRIICFEFIVVFPSLNSFTKLRVLQLEGIELSSDEADKEVSFSCPVLEKLNLTDCSLTNIKSISIFAPALTKLIVQDECGYLFDCELKIYAENLMSLKLKSDMLPQVSLCNSPSSSLSEASIITYYEHIVEDEFHLRASKFLEGVYSVKDLTLSGQFIKDLSDADLTKNLLGFTNLIHISVSVHFDCIKGGYLIELLRHLPNLEHLLVTDGLNLFEFNKQIWSKWRTPQNFLLRLKSIELRSFYGSKNEMRFAECLLKHATALEKLNVMFSSSLSEHPKKQMSITQRLLRLPRTSVCCNINFSYSHMTSTTCKWQ